MIIHQSLQGPRTCSLATLSASSSLWRSLSPCLTWSSWTWDSAFFLRFSESPLPCMRVCSSMASSFLSESSACFAFSTDTLFCRGGVEGYVRWKRRVVGLDRYIRQPILSTGKSSLTNISVKTASQLFLLIELAA